MPLYNNNSSKSNDNVKQQQLVVRTDDIITLGKRALRCRRKFVTLLLVNTVLWFFLWCNAYEVYYQMTLKITPQRNNSSQQNEDTTTDWPIEKEDFRVKAKTTEDKIKTSATSVKEEETTTQISRPPMDGDTIVQKEVALANFEVEMGNRRERVKAGCEGRNSSVVNYRELFLQKEQGLVWCPVFKAASTTWMTYFVEMSKASNVDKDHYMKIHFKRTNEVVRELYPRINTDKELQQFHSSRTEQGGTVGSFMVVRHPFNRLVSAFRDKLEKTATMRPRNDYYYRLYGQKIVARYRDRAMKKFGENFFRAENNFGTPVKLGAKGSRSSLNPTFWEFVQFVKAAKSSASIDIHWQPMSSFCSVCSLQYDYYLKFESMAEEESLFLEARNLSSVLNRHWMNNNKPTVPGLDQDQLTKRYFEQLDEEDVIALYRVYEMDFKMFDYKFEFRDIVLPLPDL